MKERNVKGDFRSKMTQQSPLFVRRKWAKKYNIKKMRENEKCG